MDFTTEEARKILGKKYDCLTDQEIDDITAKIRNFLKEMLRLFLAGKLDDIGEPAPNQIVSNQPTINKEWHLSNKMPSKATLDQKIKWHIEHVAHCKCRPIPPKIKQEIQKRLG